MHSKKPQARGITSNIHPRPSGYGPAGEEGLIVEQLRATDEKCKKRHTVSLKFENEKIKINKVYTTLMTSYVGYANEG